METAPAIVSKLYNRWRKRVFANDDIVCQPASEDGYWDIIITRGKWEACLTIAPTAYLNYRFMLDADETMRFTLKSLKGRINEEN